jgi:hypothetical protein
MGRDGRDAVRVTTTFNREQHDKLKTWAEEHSVKVAFLVRYATLRLLKEAESGTLQLDFGWGQDDA